MTSFLNGIRCVLVLVVCMILNSNAETLGPELIPMYQGYGSHYVFLYVGSPPQRQALLVDTSNHLTAMVCQPCNKCGKHIDNFWNPQNSSTVIIPDHCGATRPGATEMNKRCVVGQTYKDGSAWEGYLVKDKLHLGGLTDKETLSSSAYAMQFTFACQTAVTQLFQNQLVNGVLGLSRSVDTLPVMANIRGLTTSVVFSLCFRIGGGIMTFGGFDDRIHSGKIQWLKLTTSGIGLPPNAPIPPPPKDGNAPTIGTHEDMDDDDDDDAPKKKGKGKRGSRRLSEEQRQLAGPASKPGSIFGFGAAPHKQPANMNNRNLFTLNLRRIEARSSALPSPMPFSAPNINTGRGVVIDSSTSDIYIPASAHPMLMAVLRLSAGIVLDKDNQFTATADKLNKLPNLVFIFEGLDGDEEISIGWSTYIDNIGPSKYALSIYPTLPEGVTLGAKFFNGHNVIFDSVRGKVGVAPSTCRFEDFTDLSNDDDDDDDDEGAKRDPAVRDTPTNPDDVKNGCPMHPTQACTATCERDEDIGYTATGTQLFVNECDDKIEETRPCTEACDGYMIVRGNPLCPDSPWSECSAKGTQSRHVQVAGSKSKKNAEGKEKDKGAKKGQPQGDNNRGTAIEKDKSGTEDGKCLYEIQTRMCYKDNVAVKDGDYLIFIDLKFPIFPEDWSYVHEEAFFEAFHIMFKLRESSMSLLNDISKEYFEVSKVKLHFQLRVDADDFDNDISMLTEHAQKIAERVWEPGFKSKLVNVLEYVSKKRDNLDHARYSWIMPSDVEVLNALALPVGGVREMEEFTDDDTSYVKRFAGARLTHLDLVLIGVTIGALSIMCCVLGLYYQLRQDRFAASKDKPVSAPLRKVWRVLADGTTSEAKRGKDRRSDYGRVEAADYRAHNGEDSVPLTSANGADPDDVHL